MINPDFKKLIDFIPKNFKLIIYYFRYKYKKIF
jgi:hypothetical protein